MNANDILNYGQGTVLQAIEGLPEISLGYPRSVRGMVYKGYHCPPGFLCAA